ncbi:Na+/H+ antiporter NhaC family protein [Natronincola ferrireducens]|uniref:Transporter, NhaC family (TC 2.A.35) n=1 Tax=Natronincola ferrireducens TaxID=393762 RepID=A0A1G8XZD8_9FIRM|nr:Na+/H+ antiporter NhaC family protein [Natronincola ferrireducens]SDJ95883.1 transporter, NhaC family (TC 2.A.35) [Natronincola ferrireducens]
MKDNIVKKQDAYCISLFSLILIAVCIFFNFSLFFGFLGGIIFSFLLLLKKGFSVDDLVQIILESLKECGLLYLLILLIGATISIWLSSGVVPAMIYYGFQYMQGMNFLFSAFVITSIMGIFMGTAVGTISTMGIALLGIGRGFGVPEGVLLGAIVSGAYIADKISPISGLLNLTLSTTQTTYKETLKAMTQTLVPVYILTVLIYYYIGKTYNVNGELDSLQEYQWAILDGFYISPLLLLLPLGVLCLTIVGVKIIPTISLALLGGIIVSTSLQGMPVFDVFHAMFFGFKGNTASSELNSILFSGGIKSMFEVVLIVGGAIALSGILEKSGLIRLMIHEAIAKTKSRSKLIFKTGVISSILTATTCDQAVGIIIPSRFLKDKYQELGLNNRILARTISDTGTVIAPLIPWNVNALIIGMISGVSITSYIPYAVLCYLFPIVTMIVGSEFKIEKAISIEMES